MMLKWVVQSPPAWGRCGGRALGPPLRVVTPGVVQGTVGVGDPRLELALLLQPGSLAVDGAGDLPRVLSRQDPVQRRRDEVRVADEAVAVGEGVPRRLCEQVQVLGRAVREAAQIEALQDVERLHVCDRAGRHGGAEQLIASVGGPEGIEHLRLVVGEVLQAQEAAVSPHLLVDGGCDLAPVQGVLALPADPFEGVG